MTFHALQPNRLVLLVGQYPEAVSHVQQILCTKERWLPSAAFCDQSQVSSIVQLLGRLHINVAKSSYAFFEVFVHTKLGRGFVEVGAALGASGASPQGGLLRRYSE